MIDHLAGHNLPGFFLPREHSATITAVASGATSFQVRFVIGLHSIPLGAFVTFPLLFAAMFPSVVFLNPHQVAECMRRVVMKARPLRTYIHTFVSPQARPFQQLPRNLAATPKINVIRSLASDATSRLISTLP